MEKILIVDDDVNLCVVLSEELTEVGYSCFSVNSADEALELLSQTPIDLILLDLKMPVKDGFDVLRELREQKHFS